MNRENIIKTARSFIGTPFLFQGRIPSVGLDCVGLIVATSEKLNYPITDCQAYAHRDMIQLHRYLSLNFTAITSMVKADIISFKMPWGTHAGIYTGRTLIHAWGTRIVETVYNRYFSVRAINIYQFNGVT